MFSFLPAIPEGVNFPRRRAPGVGGKRELASGHTGQAFLALLFCALASCGPVVGNAPFSSRPDTLQAGDLLGPFDGIVVDAETERPIAGATVVGSWGFERGIGLVGPAGFREFALETSADGRYRIPRPDDVPSGGNMRLRRFTLVVYRRGYVGYRSDFKFPSGERRHDFSQHATKVRLDKWLPPMEHRRHLAFLGGGQAIAKAAGWEAQPASLEQEGRAIPQQPERKTEDAAAPVGTRMLDASLLLSVAEVRGVTGYAGELEVGRLTDRVRSDEFDSRHFKAKGKPEAFDVGVRVWLVGPAAAEDQFDKLMHELPAATATEEIGDRSLRARGGDVSGLAFLLREKGLVVQMSCGTSQCTDPGMILRLAKLVESHVAELAAHEEAKLPTAPKTGEEEAP